MSQGFRVFAAIAVMLTYVSAYSQVIILFNTPNGDKNWIENRCTQIQETMLKFKGSQPLCLGEQSFDQAVASSSVNSQVVGLFEDPQNNLLLMSYLSKTKKIKVSDLPIIISEIMDSQQSSPAEKSWATSAPVNLHDLAKMQIDKDTSVQLDFNVVNRGENSYRTSVKLKKSW